MINLINKIGQRKFAKILFIMAIVIAFLNFFITGNEHLLITWKVLLGVFLLSFPNGMMLLLALKTRTYRLFSIFLSFCFLMVNTIFYYLNIPIFLFILTVLEFIFSLLITSIFIIKNKKEDQNKAIQQHSQTVKKS